MSGSTLNKFNISDIDSNPDIKKDIMFCFKKEEVDDFFNRHNVAENDFITRTQILEKVMGVEKSYSVNTNDEITEENEYKVRLSIFLDGTWRMLNG